MTRRSRTGRFPKSTVGKLSVNPTKSWALAWENKDAKQNISNEEKEKICFKLKCFMGSVKWVIKWGEKGKCKS